MFRRPICSSVVNKILISSLGEVIGVNTMIYSQTGGSVGIGFSIPSELVIPVIEQLKDFGETRRGWLGVSIQDVSEDIALAKELTLLVHGEKALESAQKITQVLHLSAKMVRSKGYIITKRESTMVYVEVGSVMVS